MAAIVNVRLQANEGARPTAEPIRFLKAAKTVLVSGCYTSSLSFFLDDEQDLWLI